MFTQLRTVLSLVAILFAAQTLTSQTFASKVVSKVPRASSPALSPLTKGLCFDIVKAQSGLTVDQRAKFETYLESLAWYDEKVGNLTSARFIHELFKKHDVLLAHEDGKIVGFATVKHYKSLIDSTVVHIAHIVHVASPAYLNEIAEKINNLYPGVEFVVYGEVSQKKNVKDVLESMGFSHQSSIFTKQPSHPSYTKPQI